MTAPALPLLATPLEACPFCGRVPTLGGPALRRVKDVAGRWRWLVHCGGEDGDIIGCRAYIFARGTREEAIAAWNRRAPAAEAGEVDRLDLLRAIDVRAALCRLSKTDCDSVDAPINEHLPRCLVNRFAVALSPTQPGSVDVEAELRLQLETALASRHALIVTIGEIGERRVGKECGYQCRSRWSPYH